MTFGDYVGIRYVVKSIFSRKQGPTVNSVILSLFFGMCVIALVAGAFVIKLVASAYCWSYKKLPLQFNIGLWIVSAAAILTVAIVYYL